MAYTRDDPWLVQRRVLLALFVRELKTRFGQWRLGYFWALAEPLAHIGAIAAIRSTLFGSDSYGTIPFAMVLNTGICLYFIFNRAVVSGMQAINSNQGLFSYGPVKPVDTILIRVFIEVLTYSATFLIISMGFGFLSGEDVSIHNPIGVIAGFLLMGVFSLGLGMMASVVGRLYNEMTKIIPIMMRPLYFVSGMFFTLERISDEVAQYLAWNPILAIIELVRESYYENYESPFVSWRYVFLCSLITCVIGLMLLRVTRNKILATI